VPNDIAPEEQRRVCPSCHIGYIRTQRISHVAWHEGQLIVIPNIQADICDFCGEVNVEDDQVWRLDQLLRYGKDSSQIVPKTHDHTTISS
jgi:YgiT-type zinc finger domain-containing protein